MWSALRARLNTVEDGAEGVPQVPEPYFPRPRHPIMTISRVALCVKAVMSTSPNCYTSATFSISPPWPVSRHSWIWMLEHVR